MPFMAMRRKPAHLTHVPGPSPSRAESAVPLIPILHQLFGLSLLLRQICTTFFNSLSLIFLREEFPAERHPRVGAVGETVPGEAPGFS